jgi:hypothetical protein
MTIHRCTFSRCHLATCNRSTCNPNHHMHMRMLLKAAMDMLLAAVAVTVEPSRPVAEVLSTVSGHLDQGSWIRPIHHQSTCSQLGPLERTQWARASWPDAWRWSAIAMSVRVLWMLQTTEECPEAARWLQMSTMEPMERPCGTSTRHKLSTCIYSDNVLTAECIFWFAIKCKCWCKSWCCLYPCRRRCRCRRPVDVRSHSLVPRELCL